MIDIHTHILPGVDDGAVNIEEAFQMLQICKDNNIKEVVVTPHANVEGFYMNMNPEILIEKIDWLKEKAKRKFGIEIYPGMEVFATYDLDLKLMEKKILSLNGSRYVLIEFPFESSAEFFFATLKIIVQQGYIPIIAHPERYTLVQLAPEIVFEWNKRGYIVQMDSGSILGEFGERVRHISEVLLKHNLVQIVASDCHDLKFRPPVLEQSYQHVTKAYSKGYADVLMKINPRRVLLDEEVLIINPCLPR